MQPNQPFSPGPTTDQNSDQNNNPAPQVGPAYDPWTVAPQPQRPVSSQPYEPAPATDPYQTVAQQPAVQNEVPTTQPYASAPVSSFQLQYEAALQEPAVKKSPLKIIGLIIASVLVLAGGLAGFMWWQAANDPQARLYRALENHMMTKYIKQDFDMKVGESTETGVKIQALSDFSEPAKPKSYIEYQLETSIADAKYEQDGELIILDQDSYYSSMKKLPAIIDTSQPGMPSLNAWYQAKNDDTGAAFLLDPASSRYAINTITGQVLVGNFGEKTRAELMQFIKDRNVYPIGNSESVDFAGKKATHYTIQLNGKLVEELNQKAIKAMNITESNEGSTGRDQDIKLQLWINNETDRIVQAKVETTNDESSSDSSKVTGSNTITLSYPTDASKIKKPETVKSIPWKQ